MNLRNGNMVVNLADIFFDRPLEIEDIILSPDKGLKKKHYSITSHLARRSTGLQDSICIFVYIMILYH